MSERLEYEGLIRDALGQLEVGSGVDIASAISEVHAEMVRMRGLITLMPGQEFNPVVQARIQLKKWLNALVREEVAPEGVTVDHQEYCTFFAEHQTNGGRRKEKNPLNPVDFQGSVPRFSRFSVARFFEIIRERGLAKGVDVRVTLYGKNRKEMGTFDAQIAGFDQYCRVYLTGRRGAFAPVQMQLQ